MTKQTSIILEDDCATFLKEHRAITDLTQTATLNAAVRLYALLSDPDRLLKSVDRKTAGILGDLVSSPAATAPIPSRLKPR